MRFIRFFGFFSLTLICILTVSCTVPIEREQNRWYYGAVYSDSSIYVANYIVGEETSKWLTAPILFKFTCDRDSLRVYYNGTVKICPEVGHREYMWKSDDGSIVFRIKSDHVTIQPTGGKTFKALNKSMI